MYKRHFLPALLAATLALAVVSPAAAQASGKRGKLNAAEAAILDEQMQRADADPRLASQRDRLDAEVNRELFQMKESIIRESLNQMQRRRYEQPSNSRVVEQVLIFLAWMIVLSAVLWLIRTILEQRRWSRVATIQTEIHNKLLEKMASSQELLAYMETEAGKRFLESSPFEIEAKQSPAFPYGRILLSAQAGMVMLVVGVALIWLQGQLPDSAQPLLVFGTLGMALGFGLMFSAGLAYSLSRHFGLTSNPRETQ